MRDRRQVLPRVLEQVSLGEPVMPKEKADSAGRIYLSIS